MVKDGGEERVGVLEGTQNGLLDIPHPHKERASPAVKSETGPYQERFPRDRRKLRIQVGWPAKAPLGAHVACIWEPIDSRGRQHVVANRYL